MWWIRAGGGERARVVREVRGGCQNQRAWTGSKKSECRTNGSREHRKATGGAGHAFFFGSQAT